MRVPVGIILGDADPVAPPGTNGLVAANRIPGAALRPLRGVGHYDFLSACTEAGRAAVPLCRIGVDQSNTHRQAIEVAQTFFDRQLGLPKP